MDNFDLINADWGIDIAYWGKLPSSFSMHHHSFLEMIYIFTGKGFHELENGKYEIGPGDLLIVPPGVAHAYSERYNMTLVNIMFDLKKLRLDEIFQQNPVFKALFMPLPELTENFRFKNHLSLFGKDRDECEKIIHELISEEKNQRPCREAKLCSLLISLLVAIIRACEKPRYRGPGNLVMLDNIVEYMDRHTDTSIAIPDVAKKFGFSQRNLERLFRDAFQSTPLAYLNNLRLKKAERLLLETGKSIGEIADESGFPDSNYFTKVFRKKYLMSPKIFRMKHIMAY